MSSVPLLGWQQVMTLSQEMIGLAKEQQWEALILKESERKTLLVSFFSQPIPAEVAPTFASAVQSLMEMDKQMLSLFGAKRSEISQKMSGMKKGRQASAAYIAYS